MRILFDTNVLVSAFIGSGMCYEVIDHSIDEHQIFYTDFIIAEFRKILKDKFHYPESLIKNFVTFITNFFIKGQTADTVENICRDSDDDQILADALQNGIAVLVTGDKDLLDLKTYKGIKIISPQEYWKL